MDREWNITVWGVRASAPAAQAGFMEYGGNTACISVEIGDHLVMLDAGTGLTRLGESADFRKYQRVDILISHLHIDHLMGLFSFGPFFQNTDIHIHGRIGIEKCLRHLIAPPWWPVGFADFPAGVHFHETKAGESFTLSNLQVSTIPANHPGGSTVYRLDGDGKSLVYFLDCEADEKTMPALTSFAHDADLLVWDATFTDEDLVPGWGHSTWKQGLLAGRASSARRVLMSHYNQGYTDDFLREQERLACEDERCIFAKEGMVIRI